jgi:glutathione synthase/RimK-type ligase-like ATP-grasp enzyme
MICIITHQRAFETDFVIDALRDRSLSVARFNYDEIPYSATLTMLWNNGDPSTTPSLNSGFSAQVTRRNQVISTEDIKVAWFHQDWHFKFHPDLSADALQIAQAETEAAVNGLWECAPWRWVQSPAAVVMASNKLKQLAVAQQLGFPIPRTLVSSDAERAVAFLDQCDNGAIIKELSIQYAVDIQGASYLSWTRPITKDELLEVGIPLGIPACIQENVPKHIEIRATVVGDQVFPVAIDSQSSPETRHDFRRGSLTDKADHYSPMELPPEIAGRCVGLLQHFGLDYGAIDLILTPDGRYVFLELNTNGAWVWAEKLTGLPITEALADLIEKRLSQ